MKLFCAVTLVVSVCSAKILEETLNDSDFDDRYVVFIGDDENNYTLIDILEPVDDEFIKEYTSDPDNIGYWLFTRSNPVTPQILQYNNKNSVKNSNYNKDKVTVFLSHGWRGSCNSEVNNVLTKAFLQDQDVNVIVIDWSSLAGKNYRTAKDGVPGVGRCLGQFIRWLVTLGTSYERLHAVGFSLGGHVVGNAGRETEGKVQRITALDPAGPLWLITPERLNKSDAQYVEVIHTSFAGFFLPSGDTDFYPNGGLFQPGCVCIACTHSRSYELMAASVTFNNFKSNECSDIIHMGANKCTGNIELMGNSDLRPKSPGIYRVNTKREYPYDVTNITYFETDTKLEDEDFQVLVRRPHELIRKSISKNN